eukprot:8346418-Pyramimonas_sp.AAC.1
MFPENVNLQKLSSRVEHASLVGCLHSTKEFVGRSSDSRPISDVSMLQTSARDHFKSNSLLPPFVACLHLELSRENQHRLS